MTKHDQNLISFLLSADREQLAEWYERCSDEELVYATYVLDVYGHALKDEITSMKIDAEIAKMSTMVEAQAVIASVRGNR
ncbi:MAG: hypothetical protein EBU08_10935 [Micrococcales bacterium]|nr:hypothetical protein [Micrococcales bacterium]